MNTQRIELYILNLVITILAAIWIYRDSKNRDNNPVMWVVAIVFMGLAVNFLKSFGITLILLVYLLQRPKGKLLECPHCSKPRLDYLAFCPHCKKEVKKECLKCHEVMELDAERCPNCNSVMPRS